MAGRCDDLAVHDFDEIGVPSDADGRWRQEAAETWVRRVLGRQHEGGDTLVAGQSPLGEWPAAPSATRVNGIAACLLDVSDSIRVERLAERRRRHGWPPHELMAALLEWAVWHRAHAEDPQWRPEVITKDCWEEMDWTRWGNWQRGEPRWDVTTLGTSHVAIPEGQLAHWIAVKWRLRLTGKLPLSGEWWGAGSD